MSIWHWVRHGPTHQKSFVGWRDVDVDLSDTDQIARLDRFLPSDALVVSSDLKRSVKTADAICNARQRLPHMPGLREFHFGDWDGLHFSEVAAQDPQTSRAFWESPGDITPPGGESWNTSAARVAVAVQELTHAHPGREIIAVAHMGVILTQIQAALKVAPQDVLRHKIDNFSVTTIDWTRTQDRVRRINHLP